LAHGLFGFDELKLAGNRLPAIHYWRGIREAFAQRNIEVFATTVSPSASIEDRAAMLAEEIASKAQGRSVNIIA
jgi:triacylglycerol lipase